MNKEVIKQWIEALRSGNYSQGRYALHEGSRFCATGVLCDIHAKLFNGKWEHYDGVIKKYYANSGFPPDIVVDWLGLDKDQINTITIKNDIGQSFEEIAGYLEEEYLT